MSIKILSLLIVALTQLRLLTHMKVTNLNHLQMQILLLQKQLMKLLSKLTIKLKVTWLARKRLLSQQLLSLRILSQNLQLLKRLQASWQLLRITFLKNKQPLQLLNQNWKKLTLQLKTLMLTHKKKQQPLAKLKQLLMKNKQSFKQLKINLRQVLRPCNV